MNVSKFSSEIVKVGGTLIAIPTVYAIGPLYLFGMRGFGPMYWFFDIRTCLGEGGVCKIYGDEVPYSSVSSKEFNACREEDHPVYLEKKDALSGVRDQVLAIWNEYLEERK